LRFVDAEQAAGRLYDQEVAVEASGFEMIADLAEIASHARPDIGIRRRRRGAFELAIFLRELVRGGDEEMRVARLDDRFHALLVRGIAVGVQEQDRDRLYALADRVGHGGAHLILVELDQHLAVRVHALADLIAQVALDQRLVAAEEEIIGFRPIDAADLVDIAEALGGEERAWRPRAFQNGVDRNGGTVKEQARTGEPRAGLRHPFLHAGDEPRGGRERLSEAELSGDLVEGGDVGEGPAHVGRQPNST
jgi:hypothetical protein